jgi:radical SAM modification target selenobiotic family peptide
MEKKYLKKMLTGLSIASLVAGMTGITLAAGG